MCRLPSVGVLLPLIAVSLLPIAYYVFTVYVAAEQRIACSITQATNVSYSSMSHLSVLLFFAGALAVAIARMFYATVSGLHATYALWLERNSGETNEAMR